MPVDIKLKDLLSRNILWAPWHWTNTPDTWEWYILFKK